MALRARLNIYLANLACKLHQSHSQFYWFVRELHLFLYWQGRSQLRWEQENYLFSVRSKAGSKALVVAKTEREAEQLSGLRGELETSQVRLAIPKVVGVLL